MEIYQLITINSLAVNKKIAKKFGIKSAILLGELINEFNYSYDNKENVGDFFPASIRRIEAETTLTKYQQDKAIKLLQKEGTLETMIKGLPAKRYFKINVNKVIEFLI